MPHTEKENIEIRIFEKPDGATGNNNSMVSPFFLCPDMLLHTFISVRHTQMSACNAGYSKFRFEHIRAISSFKAGHTTPAGVHGEDGAASPGTDVTQAGADARNFLN